MFPGEQKLHSWIPPVSQRSRKASVSQQKAVWRLWVESSHEGTWRFGRWDKDIQRCVVWRCLKTSEDATWLDNNVLLSKLCVGSGCLLLIKLINRLSWWKGKFALFQMLATGWVGEGGRHLSKGQKLPSPFTTPHPPLVARGPRAFIDKIEGGYMQKNSSQLLQSSSNWSSVVWPESSWLFQVQLIFSSRIPLFPFLWGHFSELWQLMSWVPSGLRVVNFSTWCFSVLVSVRQSTGYGPEYYL